ncbi:MAG: Cytochrome c oxidase polypeptide 1 [Candidatus Heimdallarchaeota archaeon LC_2]|nr:MAG: Cytochrome c oxidase polypeptide 1 [Candidatus Heimdallarchaeota archaeon LC_2]
MATITQHHSTSLWKNPKQMLGTTNATELGRLYFLTTLINMAIAGLYAMMIRWELWTPEGDFFAGGNEYNTAFTLHGTAMIFLVVVPLGAGFANYLLPRMVAADNADMYWPKWNNVAFWMLPVGSVFIWLSQARGGWTAYPPLSTALSTLSGGIDMWIVGLVFAGTSSTIGGLNFTLTIWKGKAPYVKWMQLDLFVWATLFTSLLIIFATPVLTTALVMILLDRNFGTSFFDAGFSNPTMYQHIFWFYSHPAVYIMVLPAFGLVSGILAKFARRPVFGYSGMVGAMAALAVLSFMVWAHHMYVTGLDPFVRVAFTTMTFVIAIPSGIKVLNWITTLYAGNIKYSTPMLYCLSFIALFTFGGITGVYLNIIVLDLYLHGTYWVVGHFHFIVAAGTLNAMFAAFYYYFPDMTGKMYNELTAKIGFWFWVVGNFIAFTAFTILGMEGMPRRYWTYDGDFQIWHQTASVGGFLMGISFLLFLHSIMSGYFNGEPVKNKDDPFELGSGYDFPQPYADHIAETTGEKVSIDHKLSLTAPLGTFSLALPLLAIAAFAEAGPFGEIDFGTQEEGFLHKFLPGNIWGMIFLAGFVVSLVALLYTEINKDLKELTYVDEYRKDRNWEIWIFLASEVIFFGALIGSGVAMRFSSDNWPNPADVLNVPLTAVNTFILIISSYTMARGLNAIKQGKQEELQKWLLRTIGLGVLFLSIQVFEYISLANEGEVMINPDELADYPLFSSAFYLQTGFHGLHVLVGVIFLTFVYFRARKGGYSKERHEYVEFIGLYWHFVDLVWIILFTVVYLI